VLGLQSSGPHSNGYSLIRKVLEKSGDDPSMPMDGRTLGEALLAPTRIYVKSLLPLIKSFPIDGMAHITGGGISENIVRVMPAGLGLEIDLTSWELPPVFKWLQKHGGIEESEMLRTFNCGVGMALLVAEEAVEEISKALQGSGETVYRLGRVVEHMEPGTKVSYIRP
jgi:phosphoribosylformylglycinamidine cyclo-ligase